MVEKNSDPEMSSSQLRGWDMYLGQVQLQQGLNMMKLKQIRSTMFHGKF